MTIAVTGAAGFIGSTLIKALNARGERDIIAVDDLTKAGKFRNLVDLEFHEFVGRSEFIVKPPPFDVVFHQGACSDTTRPDDEQIAANYAYSLQLLEHCQRQRARMIYASSAAVYDAAGQHEAPLNAYGLSKLLFDRRVRQQPEDVVGLRYHNVYGDREGHKGRMASMVYQAVRAQQHGGILRLFEGQPRRDFIAVDDVVNVNLWFLDHPGHDGIYDVGTGHAERFERITDTLGLTVHYVPIPTEFAGRYQTCTRAQLGLLREVGYQREFIDLEDGVRDLATLLA